MKRVMFKTKNICLLQCKLNSIKLSKYISSNQVRGLDQLRDARFNKGLAFTYEERQLFGVQGLLPPRLKTMEEQLSLLSIMFKRYKNDLNKYLYLEDVHDRNQHLYFRFLYENLEETLPIVYTPTVGLACQEFGLIYRRPRGLFVTIRDRGHIIEVLRNWPHENVRAICVTDGERILGLGDLGCNGMGIPIGKLALYTALAGIPPWQCLPIQIDIGTNNEKLLADPLYVGLRKKRTTGKEYDDFMDEFMEAVVNRYDNNTLIQFEDFGYTSAFKYLKKYRDSYCTFNDDIQGTAGVVISGLYTVERVIKSKLKDSTILFVGSGQAGLGIALMLVQALISDGLSEEEAIKKIFVSDVHGLLTSERTNFTNDQKKFAKDLKPIDSLIKIITEVKPNIMIGASAVHGLFSPEILKEMAKINERPVVFALSNPTSKAECTAQEAYDNTEGRVIFASGSPFPAVKYKGKEFKPGQSNNSYIFPGVALGIIASQTHHVPDEMFIVAAKALAGTVTDADLAKGSLFPSIRRIREVSQAIAEATIKYAYKKNLAGTYPEPKDIKSWLKPKLYEFSYHRSIPPRWRYDNVDEIKTKSPKK